MSKYFTKKDIDRILHENKNVVQETPLMQSIGISSFHEANVYLKREDMQPVRSYKLRGAYNKISGLTREQKQTGVVCASAGNHAQGVAYSCAVLKIHGKIYMPVTTPGQKVKRVKMFGKQFIEVILHGDTFDDADKEAKRIAAIENKAYIHPFDDIDVIKGQATIASEILKQTNVNIDYIFIPVGGGGLMAGLSTYFKECSPQTKIIGVEPEGAASMSAALNNFKPVELNNIDTFVDGAAVKRVGSLNFEISKNQIDDMISVPEGKVCSTILRLYNEDALVVEPAGALALSALDFYKEEIKGKNVVCIISGSNNDIFRTEEIKERALLYEKLKHYFIIRFPQRAGALREFLSKVLGPEDDITHFEYSKKNNREKGPALIGIELKNSDDFNGLLKRMKKYNINYEYLNQNSNLFGYLI